VVTSSREIYSAGNIPPGDQNVNYSK